LKNNSIWWKVILLALVFIAGFTLYMNMKNKIESLHAKYAEATKLAQYNDSLYYGSIAQYSEVSVINHELKEKLEASNQKAYYYSEMYLSYKGKFDSIKTKRPDTNYVYVESKLDSTDRIFDLFLNKDIYISGYFNTVEPYMLYIKNLWLKTKLDLVISQDKDDLWYWDINTNSKYLKIDSANVKIKPFVKNKWEYFISSNVKFSYNKIVGYGFSGGLKYKEYGVGVGASILFQHNPYYEISIMKFGAF